MTSFVDKFGPFKEMFFCFADVLFVTYNAFYEKNSDNNFSWPVVIGRL
jgi:hypothetical protein